MDLVCPADDVVRHRLRLVDVGDGADDVAQGRQMLDVDRGQDIDAGVEELVDVLPALGIAAAGDVGVGVFVHNRGPGRPGQDGVEVHFLKLRAPVGQPLGRDDLESLQERPRFAAAVVHGERHHDVLAALCRAGGLPPASRRSCPLRARPPGRSAAFHVPCRHSVTWSGRRRAGSTDGAPRPAGAALRNHQDCPPDGCGGGGLVLSRMEAARCVAWKGHHDHAEQATGRSFGAAARRRGALQELAAVRPPGRQGNPPGPGRRERQPT